MIKTIQCIFCLLLLIMTSCSKVSSLANDNRNSANKENVTLVEKVVVNSVEVISSGYLIGKWNLLLPDGGFSQNEFLLFEKQGEKVKCKGVYQKFIFDGEVLFSDGQVVMIDKKNGNFAINLVKSIEPNKDGAITLDLPSNEEDIQFGMYQKDAVLLEQ